MTKILNKKDIKRLIKLEARLEKNVLRGVAYLDKRFGKKDWLRSLNEHILDVGDANICISGQLFGDYFAWKGDLADSTAEKLGFWVKNNDNYLGDSIEGSNDSTIDNVQSYDMLTNIWFCVIRSLRKVRGVKYDPDFVLPTKK